MVMSLCTFPMPNDELLVYPDKYSRVRVIVPPILWAIKSTWVAAACLAWRKSLMVVWISSKTKGALNANPNEFVRAVDRDSENGVTLDRAPLGVIVVRPPNGKLGIAKP